jgi:GNAT superfamily N-acetyltransferase
MQPLIIVSQDPQEADRQAILSALVRHNDEIAGPSGYETIAILLRDPGNGETIGGLWGTISYDWMFVALLFVPQPLRGQGLGTRLIRAAEQLAQDKDCAGIWLDTFGFQAPEFYKGLGYKILGELPDHPRGTNRFLFQKILASTDNPSKPA